MNVGNGSSSNDDRNFGSHFLGDILDWIASELEPTQVFDKDDLLQWIANNFSIKDVFSESDAVEWVRKLGYFLEQESG